MTRAALRVVLGPVLMWALVSPAAAGAQDNDDAFKRGLDARGGKRWLEVVKHMRAAIATNPNEGTRKVGAVLGIGGTEYMPHYLLGEALFETGDCAGAVEEWAVSEQQGVVRTKVEFAAKMRQGYQSCETKGVLLPAPFNQISQSTLAAYTSARQLAQGVFTAGSANREIWQGEFESQYARGQREIDAAYKALTTANRSRLSADFETARAAIARGLEVLVPLEARFKATVANVAKVEDQSRQVAQAIAAAEAIDQSIEGLKASLTPPLATSRREGQNQLAQARERMNAGQRTQSQSVVGDAAKYAAAASVTLTGVLDQARKLGRAAQDQRLADATAAATQAFAFVNNSLSTLERLTVEKAAAVKPGLGAERETIQKEVDALRRRLDRARRAEDITGIQAATRLAAETLARLDALITSFGPVTLRDRGVHVALEEGARLYFGGEYQKARAALAPAAGLSDAPLQLHVHLFRAAAAYGLYVQSGESNRSLHDEAVAEIAQCKQLDAAFTPDAKAFSPRFIAFYQADGGAPSPSATPGSSR